MFKKVGGSSSSLIPIEEYNAERDDQFIEQVFRPYLSNLFQDLNLRAAAEIDSEPDYLDKVSFVEYTSLPGIINDRFHILFSEQANKKYQTVHFKRYERVKKSKFIDNITLIFIGSLDDKIKFTFKMYDFDNDGIITPEDIRMIMSYLPFKRNGKLVEENDQYTRGRRASPSRIKSLNKVEGMLQESEGKNVNFSDRINDQEEIKKFIDEIFQSGVGGVTNDQMNLSQYMFIVKTVSSEMFYSLMALLHDKLPCAGGYFQLRNEFKNKNSGNSKSPVRTIAAPNMIMGLSPTRKTTQQFKSQEIYGKEVRISKKNLASSALSNISSLKANDQSPIPPQNRTGFESIELSNILKPGNNLPTTPMRINRTNKLRMTFEASNGPDRATKSSLVSPINYEKTNGLRFNFNESTNSNEESETPLENFGNEQEKHGGGILEGKCWLKTQSNKHKEHYARIVGNELYCYRKKGDKEPRVMHSLIGTFLQEQPTEGDGNE